ncbi:LysR family transcriptional regulator [Limosilactobacillus caecicola]|uniref:LysR family transcriptional regulator n=1 Tax=Limosilactobacillus caecicola TaxID=2941332 RepID=UPI00203AD552|nr:LysR family transcriptional regulator [Limosilactobacillus caecicola]
MRITDLEAFIQLYRLQSFTKAAQRVHLSQSDFSKRLRALQDELNVELVDTSNRRQIKITPSGKVVYEHAVAMVLQYQQMMNELSLNRDNLDHVLHIGTIPVAGQYGIASCINHFNHQYPRIRVQLQENNGDAIIEQLQAGQLDAAILRDTQTMAFSEVEYQKLPLVTDQLMVLMNVANPLRRVTNLTIDDLRDTKIASLPVGSGVYEPIVKLFQQCGLTPNVVFQSSHIETLIGILSNPDTVSILFKRSAAPFLNDQLVMKPLVPEVRSQLQFVYPERRGTYQLNHLQAYLLEHLAGANVADS